MTGRIWVALAAATILAACDDKAATDGAVAANGDDGDAAVEMVRDAAVDTPFGSAGPRKCPNKKQPASGPPSPAQAAAYTTCAVEGQTSDMLYLVDTVTVTDIGKERKYNPLEDINMSNIDINRPVYAIRGNYKHFQCRYLDGHGGEAAKGANCTETAQPNATGLCYTDTFGDWQCSMTDVSAPYGRNREAAPPA